MAKEFNEDEDTGFFKSFSDEEKADLLLYFIYKGAKRLEIILGLITIWSAAVLGGLIIYWFRG